MSIINETVFPRHKKYRGCIRWVKLKLSDNRFKIEKRRPYGWDSYHITEAEYNYITNNRKAEEIWGYHHMMGTASWWGGERKHPIPEFQTAYEDALMNKESLAPDYRTSLVDVVWQMFNLVSNCIVKDREVICQ